MRKYYRSVIREFKLYGLMIVVMLAYFFGIFGLACHQNDSWNCTVMDIAANAQLHGLIIFFLALPFLGGSFEVAGADAPIVARILWPVFGLLLSVVVVSIMLTAYWAVRDAAF